MNELKRILLAEDDERDVELTLMALADFNLANEIDVVRDGQEALDYLFRHEKYQHRVTADPALILLDLKMPRLDGLDVLKAIRADERVQMTPVVILTSSREERDIVDSYMLGVNAYVVKPVDFHQFIEAIKRIGAFWAVVNEPPPLRTEQVGST